MKIYGGVYYSENGISTSIRGMHMQTELLGCISSNVSGFNKVGYQKELPVISSFSEYVGVHGLSKVKDDNVGRLYQSGNPLDLALGKKGYFQCVTPNGVKLIRDGRFKLDKNGNLLTLENFKVLGNDGQAIKFKHMPEKLEDIKISVDGKISVMNIKENKMQDMGTLSVVSSDGNVMSDVDVRQGFSETSNVSLHEEFFNMVPVRRNFDANRQLYIIQNDELTKAIQSLGSSS